MNCEICFHEFKTHDGAIRLTDVGIINAEPDNCDYLEWEENHTEGYVCSDCYINKIQPLFKR